MQYGFELAVVGGLVLVAGGWGISVYLGLRRARLALEQAQQTLAERNEFLGMMAHEMLTPLQTLISSVELIELSGHLPSDDQAFRRLRRSAQQLEAQMNDTVEFARLSGGRLKVSPMLFQPDLMMRIIVAEYEEAARERGVRLEVCVDPEPCPRVITDPARLRQIITNLISNSVKYANPGEVLCSVQVQEAPAQVTIAVMDRGPGFDAAVDVWAPFVRGSKTQQGAGLGLAVVKLMSDLLQGTARVVSRVGEGTAFIVQIPVEIERTQEVRAAVPTSRRQRVLVVDDNDDVRQGLLAMLQALGAQAEGAASVARALQMLQTTRYDGLVLDLCLHDGSGYDVARAARQPGGLNVETPIVALSAYHESDAEGDLLLAAKFEKPISVARLRSAMQHFA